MPREVLLRRSRPLRRAVVLLTLAGIAHVLLLWAAVDATDPRLDLLAPLATPSLGITPIAAFLGAGLATLSFLAAWLLSRVRPSARHVGIAAATASLLNVPLGTVLGLVALAHLQAPRVRRVFRERVKLRLPPSEA